MHAVTGIAAATSHPRRILMILLLAIGVTVGWTSTPAQAVEPAYRGLFGSQDPTYDGVDRHATAILGLVAVGATVPRASISWLLGQQCPNGSFYAFRANTSIPCKAPDLVTYTGPNTNSTALAAMALSALASSDAQGTGVARKAARKAIAWLVARQQSDGGWEWLAGLGSDSTSTAMTLAAIGRAQSTAHRKGVAFLKSTMPTGMDCGVAFNASSPVIDPLSTSWALLATQGALPYARYRGTRAVQACPATGAGVRATGSWLATQLTTGNGRIPSAFEPGQTDWNVTALATLGMSGRDGSTQAMRLGLRALKANVSAYVVKDNADRAAPLGTLLMVAHATASDPRDFGGVDLTRRLRLIAQK